MVQAGCMSPCEMSPCAPALPSASAPPALPCAAPGAPTRTWRRPRSGSRACTCRGGGRGRGADEGQGGTRPGSVGVEHQTPTQHPQPLNWRMHPPGGRGGCRRGGHDEAQGCMRGAGSEAVPWDMCSRTPRAQATCSPLWQPQLPSNSPALLQPPFLLPLSTPHHTCGGTSSWFALV